MGAKAHWPHQLSNATVIGRVQFRWTMNVVQIFSVNKYRMQFSGYATAGADTSFNELILNTSCQCDRSTNYPDVHIVYPTVYLFDRKPRNFP